MSIKNYRFRIIYLQTIVRSSLRLLQSHPPSKNQAIRVAKLSLQRIPDTSPSNIDFLPVLPTDQTSISSHSSNHLAFVVQALVESSPELIQDPKLLTTRSQRSQKSIFSHLSSFAKNHDFKSSIESPAVLSLSRPSSSRLPSPSESPKLLRHCRHRFPFSPDLDFRALFNVLLIESTFHVFHFLYPVFAPFNISDSGVTVYCYPFLYLSRRFGYQASIFPPHSPLSARNLANPRPSLRPSFTTNQVYTQCTLE